MRYLFSMSYERYERQPVATEAETLCNHSVEICQHCIHKSQRQIINRTFWRNQTAILRLHPQKSEVILISSVQT